MRKVDNQKINEDLLDSFDPYDSIDSIGNSDAAIKISKHYIAIENETLQIQKLHREQKLSSSEITNKLIKGYSKVYRTIKIFESLQLDILKYF